MAPLLYLHHESSLDHDTGVHPERSERIVALEAELERRGWAGLRRAASSPVPRDTLTAVHPPGYVDELAAISADGGGLLDLDTVMSAGSFTAALHAAGGAVELVDALVAGEAPAGISAHRPPGHHALPDRAMGFCLFNSIAVAARHACDAHGLERVLILDWDVHHGNGTNDIFLGSREVLFCSIHQSPLYPGTGAAQDVGAGPGEGFTINLPVPAGSGDDLFCSHVEHLVCRVVRAWEPQLVLVSAGYDAHERDPIGGCRVTDAGYAAMTAAVRRAAGDVGAPVGMVLEGGYDLAALASGVAVTLEALGEPGGSPAVATHPETVAAAARAARWWPDLAGLRAGDS